LSWLAELEFEERGDVVIASVTGELDLSNVHDISDALSAAVAPSAAGFVLDLSALRHLDSAGVRLLFELRTKLVNTRRGFAIVVPDGAVIMEVLELAAVRTTLPVHADLDAAVASIPT
jgi:anti-anti-sigma factor